MCPFVREKIYINDMHAPMLSQQRKRQTVGYSLPDMNMSCMALYEAPATKEM